MLEQVLGYARRGWHLVPVREGKHAGSVLGRGWQLKSSCDPSIVRKWFAEPVSVAVHLGPISGIIDVETDSVEGIRASEKTFGHIVTPVFQSKRSVHRIFRHVPGLLDVRATKIDIDLFECRVGRNRPDGSPMGCISLLPPSEHRQWLRSPEECEAADPPEWLVERLLDHGRPPVREPIVLPDWVTPKDIADAARAFVLSAPPAIQGEGGDHQTYMVAWELVSGYGCDFEEAMRLMRTYNKRCEPRWRREALEHKVRAALDYRTQKYWAALRDFSEEIQLTREVSGPVISLELYRRAMARARARAGPGVFLDHSVTGSGKSWADIEASARRTTEPDTRVSLTVIPDHANCREVVAEQRARGLDAMAWPQMSKDTCRRFDEVEEVAPSGLPPAMILCPRCPFADGCTYRDAADAAKGAPHLVITHRRFALQPEMARGRQYVAIHEDARAILGPMQLITPKDLIGTIDALEKLRPIMDQWPEGLEYTDAVIDLGESLRRRLRRTDKTEITSERPCALAAQPSGWVRAVWKLRKQVDARIPGDALLALTTLVSGEFARWALMISKSRKASVRHLVVVQKVELPHGKTYVFGDATGRPEVIRDLTGDAVTDITPAGRLRQKRSITQVPTPLSRNSAEGTVERYLRHIVARIPDRNRIGVITFQREARLLFGEESPLEPPLRQRIAKWTYFGSGVDRASNDWTRRCDVLLVLGTPYIPRFAIRAELIRRGLAAGCLAPPHRVPANWVGQGKGGRVTPVKTRVFGNEHWRSAEDSLVTASLEQAIGRARVFSDGGLDVVIVSDRLVDFDGIICPGKPNTKLDSMLGAVQRESPAGITSADAAAEIGGNRNYASRQLKQEERVNLNLHRIKQRWIWAT